MFRPKKNMFICKNDIFAVFEGNYAFRVFYIFPAFFLDILRYLNENVSEFFLEILQVKMVSKIQN